MSNVRPHLKHYSVPVSDEDKAAFQVLAAGVRQIGVIGRAKGLEGVFGCVLETTSGETVVVRAQQEDLEYTFEVFPLTASVGAPFAEACDFQPWVLAAPVQVELLETEEWLDPTIPCEGALGHNPVMQCQGRPGEAPNGATAVCRYFGGIELSGSNGSTLIIATLPFPFAIHVSAIPGTGKVYRHAYVGVDVREA